MFSLKNPCNRVATLTAAIMQGCSSNSDHADALLLKGYPIPLSRKKRDCLVAYSHSTRDHFENAFGDTIKSKYFMTVLRAIVTNMTTPRRFDSTRFFNLLLSSCETTPAHAHAQSRALQRECRIKSIAGQIRQVYLLDRSQRPRFSNSARIENQGRTRRSAAVCALATPSQRWSGCNS